MGLGTYYVTSPRRCFSTEDYNEWMNKHYHNSNDGIIFPEWSYLPYCDKCEKYIEFVDNICSNY